MHLVERALLWGIALTIILTWFSDAVTTPPVFFADPTLRPRCYIQSVRESDHVMTATPGVAKREGGAWVCEAIVTPAAWHNPEGEVSVWRRGADGWYSGPVTSDANGTIRLNLPVQPDCEPGDVRMEDGQAWVCG